LKLELPPPGSFPCLYVSPHAEVAVRSCGARMAWPRQQGHGVLVVVLFGDVVGTLPAGVQGLACALPDARQRHPDHGTLRARLEARGPEDEDALARAAALLDTLARRAGARDVYVPLGLGQQLDHILGHEAALRAFHADAGRNVFLYEEAPYASVRGAVRVRMATMGAQLPPGAAPPRRAWLLTYVLASLWTLQDRSGLVERLGSFGSLARPWRAARAWRPQRAFGPRVQPVEQETAPTGYARFWLLLPERYGAGELHIPALPEPAAS
jgi:hypothetical protein